MLHRIPPGTKLAGTLEIDEDAARRAVGAVASGLGVDVTKAAQAIIDIANENMHAALRVVSIERGFDPVSSACSRSAGRARCMPTPWVAWSTPTLW